MKIENTIPDDLNELIIGIWVLIGFVFMFIDNDSLKSIGRAMFSGTIFSHMIITVISANIANVPIRGSRGGWVVSYPRKRKNR